MQPTIRPARGDSCGRVFQLGPVTVRSILNAADTGGAMEMLELSAGPDGRSPPAHIHRRAHETFHVLEGVVEFIVAGETRRAEPGDTVHVPPGVAHTFRYLGPTRNRFVAVLTPAIDMERYFAELEVLLRESMPPDRAKAVALMARFDQTLA